jgi:hypothetical protein
VYFKLRFPGIPEYRFFPETEMKMARVVTETRGIIIEQEAGM